MEVTRDKAAAGAGEAQARNPIHNGNPNPNSNPNPNPNSPHTTRGSNRKTCMGCTYYSSVHKAKSKNPTCVGFSRRLEQVLEEKSSTSRVGHVASHAHKTEEHEHATQPRRYKPPNTTAEEFLNRFQRNASLVASGVLRNLNRVSNYVKETLDDILYRRPK